ncbi:MoxR family ATPase [Clostridium sp. OM02-18AC]|uniref:AAA family ATPase n=1 Tax=Clostridium sp. OM02-18AC TaxID=2292311 RepID=UPI000E4F1059|nr:MoxR family ATPase [Clostridium sp. OM02-18AC]RHV68376.1 MoxR family ATPase [Clostridium sp. OM02-18AC]
MILEQSEHIIEEVKKAFMGKDEIIRRVLMTIYAGGHILLEDCPGVGKTTLTLAFSHVLDLSYKRIQFTTDTLPSDITGFTTYNRQKDSFEYHEGAVACNLLLADEINRTSPKTQSALLEAMEEGSVTVDGVTYPLPNPFICIATQNPVGAAGTQALPESQLDRFMVRLSIGYPTAEDQVRILKARRYANPINEIKIAATAESILDIRNYLSSLQIRDEVLYYLIRLCEATREHPLVELGVSPRGVLALTQMAKAHAVLAERGYVIPEDVQAVFVDVCAHRLILKPQARVEGISETEILRRILAEVKTPSMTRGWKRD